MRLDWPLRIATPALAALLLCGCPNPNTYTTPRTLNQGDLQLQVAAEAFGASFNQTVPNQNVGTHTETASVFTPVLPTVGVRYGLADGFELGARVTNLDSLSLDGKIRLIKGTFDLAVDPGVQGYYLSVSGSDAANQTTNSSAAVFYFHVPVLLGLNLSEATSIVLSPGFTYGAATTSITSGNNTQQAGGATGVMGRLGAGVDIRLSKKFALHPEITFIKSFTDSEALLYLFGLGFNIGAQPDFSDMRGAPEAAPKQDAPALGGDK
jgi:hypothetical protein